MSFIVKVDIGDPSTELIHETSADLVCVLSGSKTFNNTGVDLLLTLTLALRLLLTPLGVGHGVSQTSSRSVASGTH